MDLSKILAVSGKGGLFEIVGQTRNGVIVQSLLDGKRYPTYANQQISALEEISIYGEVDDIPLKEVFQKIYDVENGAVTSVKPKASGADIRDYFSDIVPDFDEERVYNSDIKKVMSWYNLLLDKGFLEPTEEAEEEKVVEEAAAEDTAEPTEGE
ncbi:DUF5606 domain-containing protein [bacterium SCSIO 12741]|nr:DUF5606 domain-containing protein [bacterium SCSIO 12741]